MLILRILWLSACVIGFGQLGWLPFLFAGLPLGMLAFATAHSMTQRANLLRLILSVGMSIGLLWLTLIGGTPDNLTTWLVVCGTVVWTLVLCLIMPPRNELLILLPAFSGVVAFYAVAYYLPSHGTRCADLRNGRLGVMLGHNVVLEGEGPNTPLIYSAIGPGAPDWFLTNTCDGKEVVELPDTRSLVFSVTRPTQFRAERSDRSVNRR